MRYESQSLEFKNCKAIQKLNGVTKFYHSYTCLSIEIESRH